jgi:DNA-binding IclR family transcriptional regulator
MAYINPEWRIAQKNFSECPMPNVVPTVQRTMAAFEAFEREKRELSNSYMARLLSVADSTCHDLMHTLHTLGYLMRTPQTKRFYPTVRLYETARRIKENDPLSAIAHEAVAKLMERTNETAFFGVLERSAVKVIAVQPCRHPLRYTLEVGERVALHASGFGKALLGLMAPDELASEVRKLNLRSVTPHSITDPAELFAQIQLGQRRGWYETRGEGTAGVVAVAVSGWLGGQAVALSLAGPTERVDSNRELYLEALRQARDEFLSNE